MAEFVYNHEHKWIYKKTLGGYWECKLCYKCVRKEPQWEAFKHQQEKRTDIGPSRPPELRQT